MLGLVAVILIVGVIQSPGRAIPKVSQLPSPNKPLDKPEPGRLLSRTDLHLNPRQETKIAAIDRLWQSDKVRLVREMSGYQPKQGRVEQIDADLQGYSELSRSYDATRRAYWSQAVSVLDPTQRAELGGER